MELKSLQSINYISHHNYIVKDIFRQYSIVVMTNRKVSNMIIYDMHRNSEDSKLYKQYTDYVETILPSETFVIDHDLMMRSFILRCFELDESRMYKERNVNNIKMVKTNPFELLSSIYNTYILTGLKFRISPVRKISKSTMYCPIEIGLIDGDHRCKCKASKNEYLARDETHINTIDDYSTLLKSESIDPVLTKFHNFFSFISKRKEFMIDIVNSNMNLDRMSETGYSKILTFSKKYTVSNIENFYKVLRYNYNNDDLSNPKLTKLTKLIKSLPSKPRFKFAVTVNSVHIVIDCGIGVVSRKMIVNWSISIPTQRTCGRSFNQSDIEPNMINIFLKGLEEFDAVDIVINKLEMKLLSII